METRNPVKVYFGSEFPAICNHCRVTATWSRKTLKIRKKFLRFLEDPLREIFPNSVPKVFIAIRSTYCIQISWNLAAENRWYRALLTCQKKQISPGSPAIATARIVPKICHGQPPTMYSECYRFHPNRFTFGKVIAERVNTAKACRKVNAILGWGLASSRIKTVQWLPHTSHFQSSIS